VQARERRDPERVGPYRILARLGVGGTAIVYFGHSPSGRPVAVKVLHADLTGDPALRARFRHEVRAVRAAGGRWSPTLIDADTEASPPWLVTEFLPAVSLREAVRRFGVLRPGAAWTLAAGLAEALQSIHRAGIVHCDLKPGNVLLTADGPRLIDFGVARSGAGVDAGIAGSLGYMAPEQVAGGPIGPATDVYAFGATLAFMCTGHPPPPDDPAAGVTDPATLDVVTRCLHRDPAGRPGVPELLTRLAARPDTTPLPADVAAAIDARAAEAANPPLPTTGPPRPDRRRAVLLGLAGFVGIAGATTAAVVTGAWRPHGAGRPVAEPTNGPSSSVVASPSVPARARVLEFVINGQATFAAVTYTVDGVATTVRDVTLPWHVAVQIPPLPRKTAWRLQFRLVPGDFRFAVLIDGFRLDGGSASGALPPRDEDLNGVD
jgi:hypothetical protein